MLVGASMNKNLFSLRKKGIVPFEGGFFKEERKKKKTREPTKYNVSNAFLQIAFVGPTL